MASQEPSWERRYSRKLLWTDTAVILATVAVAQVIGGTRIFETSTLGQFLRHAVIPATLIIAWSAALIMQDSRKPAVFATGPEEYKRVIDGTVFAFGVTAILIVLSAPPQFHRVMLFISLPCGLILILLGRWVWRKRLQHQRRRGKNTYRTLIVGERGHSTHSVRQLRSNAIAGFKLLGAVTESGSQHELLPGLPVVADYDSLLDAVDQYDIDVVIVTSSDALTPDRLRRIGWELEGRYVDLILAASLIDIAGPRIHVRPVSGLPLIHVEYPEFSGQRYYAKRLFDVVGAVILLIPAAIIMALLAFAIKREDPGPIIFKQVRLGLDGREFIMFKLRSMHQDAEDELPSLLDRSEGNATLFKIKADPRVTRVGRFMRRHSFDELPQLINVLKGDMSLVGPRPPLPREAEQYGKWEDRRLLVRPGVSGLWQVSGRSDLSWEESVRLDLFYVENWSMTGDLLILWRTLRAIVKPEGAY